MRYYSQLPLERIMLKCRCGEIMTLLGQEEDWHLEGHTIECGCGETLSITDNRVSEEVLDIKQLIRGLRNS
ncbi:MAG: hypothetical protein JOZ19_10870 [Rubrobacter sp.]|nr:hypothetical protein [Rubrobacter sp.]